MSVHAQLYELGLSVSYQRVDDIINNLATSVCDHFKSVGVVCPLSLQSDLFTVGAIDNRDHDPALYKLQHVAFQELNGQLDEEEFQKWHDGMIKTSPTYKFWDMIMQMELKVLAFVKATSLCT